jgi:hypothetical protein
MNAKQLFLLTSLLLFACMHALAQQDGAVVGWDPISVTHGDDSSDAAYLVFFGGPLFGLVLGACRTIASYRRTKPTLVMLRLS